MGRNRKTCGTEPSGWRLRERLAEAEQALASIRNGEVDAIEVDGPHGHKIFTLQTADQPYRILVEQMSEGAASMSADGTILFCNQRLAAMVGRPAEQLLGASATVFVSPSERKNLQTLLARALRGEVREEMQFQHANGTVVPVLASLKVTSINESPTLCLVATDLTELKLAQKEKRRSQTALHESEQTLRLFIEHAPAALAMFDREMRYLQASRRWRQDYGLGERDLTGISHYDVFPEIPERWKEVHQRGLAGEILREENDRFERADGSVQWIRWEVRPWHDASGGIGGIVIFAEDVTDRKQAEDEIRESRAKLEAALASMTDAVFISDTKGHFVDFNEGFATFHKFKSKAECAKTLAEYPEFLEVFMDNGQLAPLEMWTVPRALRGETVTNAEYTLRRKDTGESWVGSYSFAPIRDKDGAIVGSVVVGRDITQKKAIEREICELNRELEDRVEQRTAQLHESEQRVRRKLDSILSPQGDLGNLALSDILDIPAIQALMEDFYAVFRVPTALLDLRGNVLTAVGWQNICVKFHRANPDSCENCKKSDLELAAGVAAGEFKIYKCKNNMWDLATPIIVGGHHIGNLFCGQFFFADEAIDYELFRAQARKYGFNEEEYMAALEASPRLSRAEVNASMAFLARLAKMISQLSYSSIQLARSSAQVARVNAELAASNKELEAFTYSVSHDLRAPLRHINGFSKMLMEEFGSALPPEAQHYVERISQGTRRMGSLVDDLLNLGRVGRQELRLQVTGLRSLVDEIIAELQPDCSDRQVEWKIGALPFVDCDPGLLKQVLQNLLSNALKFTRPRTPAVIEIGQREESRAPVIYVRDNGVGFSMKYADKLFGVFQRLHRQEDFEGTGVGLATVQRIIQKHGGRIWAEAELDRGAIFYFTLAVAETGSAAAKFVSVGGER